MCPDTSKLQIYVIASPKIYDRQGKVCRITFSNSSLEPTENMGGGHERENSNAGR
jgi:hypothetical protein